MVLWLICSPGSRTKAASVPPDSVNDDREALAGDAPVRVPDCDRLVRERADVRRCERCRDCVVDGVQVGGAHESLERRDVRLVGVVEREPVRDALAHPGVPRVGVLDRRRVGVDEDVDGGQVAHAASPSLAKTVVQSSFMLTTVQPNSLALARDFSAALV